MAEAEQTVAKMSTLTERQRQLVEGLERAGNDLTSAMIVFDSFLVSLALSVRERSRLRNELRPESAASAA